VPNESQGRRGITAEKPGVPVGALVKAISFSVRFKMRKKAWEHKVRRSAETSREAEAGAGPAIHCHRRRLVRRHNPN
jgi:hypothetical protein